MVLTRKYDNGPSGWTDYDSNGNAVASGTSSGAASGYTASDYSRPNASYVTNEKGQTTSQYNQDNTRYNVLPDSVFDPLSKNYNSLVANSGGRITLSDLDSSASGGLSANYRGTAGSGSTANTSGVAGNYGVTPNYNGMSGGSPQPTNNTALINQQNDAALQSTIAAIKAAVQQAKAKQQTIIDKTAPEQYGNLKNVVYGQSIAALPGMRENTANLGASDQGGYSRTTETRANSELQNRLGELDRQKQSVIDQANFAIADLESQGLINEANATKESALAKLQQIVAESARLDTLNNTNYWNAQQMTNDNYWKNVNQSNYQQQASTAQAQQEKDNEYRNATLALQQQAQVWQQQFQQQGYTADEAYRQAQLRFQQEQAALDERYRYTALAKSGSSISQTSPTGRTNQDEAMISIDEQLEQGVSPGNIASSIESQRAKLAKQGINVDALIRAVWSKAGISTKPEVEDPGR